MDRYIKGLLLILIFLISSLPTLPASAVEGAKIRTFDFSPPEFAKVKGFDFVRIEGLKFSAVEGRPYLPMKAAVFVLDAGSKVLNITVRMKYKALEGKFRIPPPPKPRILNNLSSLEFTDPDPGIYSMNSPFPSTPYTYREFNGLNPDTLKPAKYVVVYLYPLRYVPATGELYFSPSATVELTYEPAGRTSLQDDLDLLIVAPSEFYPQAERLARARNESGIATAIETLDQIYVNYMGADGPEKIRNCIKDYRLNHGIEFVLLFGDADKVPVRLAYIPDGYDDSDDPNYSGDGSFVETDLYYADLDGTWNADGDAYWGEIQDDGIDGVPDVFVGRLPASDIEEAQTLVDKVLNYSPRNEWFMSYLMLGTDPFSGNAVSEGEYLKDYITSNFVWGNFTVKKLYESWGSLTVEDAIGEIDKGYGFVNFAGHGNPQGWSFGSGGFYTLNDAYAQTNENASVIFTMACSTSRFYDTDSMAEAFLLNPNGGGIAYFGSTRDAWGYMGTAIIDGLAGEMDWRFNEALFRCINSSGPYLGKIWGMAEVNYAIDHPPEGSVLDWKTIAEYGTPMGDPSLPVRGEGGAPPLQPFILHGTIYDAETGDGLINALVSLYAQSDGVLIGSTYTDDQGDYYIQGSGYTHAILKVEKDGYYVREKAVQLGQDTKVDIYLVPKIDEEVLLVVDDDGDGQEGVWPSEIESALDSMGLSYFTWYESKYGRPPLKALQDAQIGVMWHVGTYADMAVDLEDADTLIQFVEGGGNVVVEGEDIGYDHGDDEFMQSVAHAIYRVDDTGTYTLEVAEPEHPVARNLPETFSFEYPPPYPDGVEPTNGGEEVIHYQDGYSAVVTYDGWPEGQGRVVYFAFPLHYLYAEERSTLIGNSIRWIAGVGTLKLNVWPSKGVAMPDVLNVFFLQGDGFPGEEELWFYLGGWDEATGHVILGVPGDVSVTATTAPTGSIPSHAFIAFDGSLLPTNFLGVATAQASPSTSERAQKPIGFINDISKVPYLTVKGGKVKVGDSLKVKGENFTPDGIVKVFWNGPEGLIMTTTADGSGRIDVDVTVPESPSGKAVLLVYDAEKGLLAMNRKNGDRLWLQFTVEPGIELDGSSIGGLKGEKFNLIGHGFSYIGEGPSYMAYIPGHLEANATNLAGVGLIHNATDSDTNGLVSFRCKIPVNITETGFLEVSAEWRAGNHTENATGLIPVSKPGWPAGASFDPYVDTHIVGHVGDEFDIYAWNFDWVELIEVWFNDIHIGFMNPDLNGFSHSKFTVPETPSGKYEVRVAQGSKEATLLYTVEPSMSINASGLSVESGRWVTIYAYGLNTSKSYIPLEASNEILPNTEFKIIEGVKVSPTAIRPNENGTIILEYRTFYDPSSFWTGDPISVFLGGLKDRYMAVGSPRLNVTTFPPISLKDVGLISPRSLCHGRDVWIADESGLIRVPRHGEPERYEIQAVLIGEGSGYLWFSTTDARIGRLDIRSGLVEYWAIPSNATDLAVDRRGNVWFTYAQGYGVIDARTGQLGLFGLECSPAGIALDRRGNVWAALPDLSSMLFRDSRTGKEQIYELTNAPEWVAIDRRGNVWFTSGELLGSFQRGEELYWNLGIRLGRLSGDAYGNLWILAQDRVIRFHDGEWKEFEVHGVKWLSAGRRAIWLLIDDEMASFQIRRGLTFDYEIPSINVTSVYKSGSAIYALDVKHDALLKISDGLKVYGLSTWARQLAGDRDGNLWIATSRGLLKFDGKEFTNVTFIPAYAVTADRRGDVWFSEYGYVVKYEVRRDRMLRYYASGYLPEMLALSRDGVWFASGSKLILMDVRANETVKELEMPSKITAIATDRYGNLWVALKDGLAEIHRRSFAIEFFDIEGIHGMSATRNLVYVMNGTTTVKGHRGTVAYLTPGTACSIFIDRRGNMIIGTMDGHIYLFDFRAKP